MSPPTKICNKSLTFNECEFAVLHHAIEQTEEKRQTDLANNADIHKMISIVEDFIISKKLICYGGTAINNILPKEAQFYDNSKEIPDYDFFSTDALDDAKRLADIFFKEGYRDVEAKAGTHRGTYKVFVNFIGIADITQMNPRIFKNIYKESIIVGRIHYAPPNYLRMSMFVELSRPDGDTSRWEKVFSRLQLLNTYHPMELPKKSEPITPDDKLTFLKDTLIAEKVVFFGAYHSDKEMFELPFDVLSEDCKKTANAILFDAKERGIRSEMKTFPAVGELVGEHILIRLAGKSVVRIYRPIACHNYNEWNEEGQIVRVATLDTMLSFYLAFLYIKKPEEKARIMQLSQLLFRRLQNHRKPLLQRFTLTCYGKQKTLMDIRYEKAEKYSDFVTKGISKQSKEFQLWFLAYRPSEIKKEMQQKTHRKKHTHKKPSILERFTRKRRFL